MGITAAEFDGGQAWREGLGWRNWREAEEGREALREADDRREAE
ncbi:hypothetical protein [Amycolatopsis sp. A1MSW2902]